jgi:hypothetical protein
MSSGDATELPKKSIKQALGDVGQTIKDQLKESQSTNIYLWRFIYFLIILLIVGLGTLGYFYGILKNEKCSTSKYQVWPDSKKDHAFSIKLQEDNSDTKRCLQPHLFTTNGVIIKNGDLINDRNLILDNGCDEDNIRFKTVNERLLKQHGNLNDICLKTKDDSGRIEIVYDKGCTDQGKYIYKDSKIMYENDKNKDANGKCFKIDSNDRVSKVTLQNCENATNFDLI